MKIKQISFIVFCVMVLFNHLNIAIAQNSSSYQTPQPFKNLYFDFTGSTDPDYPQNKINISQMLFQAEMKNNTALGNQEGPLVMFMNSSLYVYNAQGKRQLSLLMRTAPDSGFIEMTAISHIGPALAYLARLKEFGDDRWRSGLEMLLKDIKAIRAINLQSKNNWLDEVNASAWSAHKSSIHNMIDYACSSSGNYIKDVLAGNKQFTLATLQKDFFEENPNYPIPYNDVMVATFMLTALQSMTEIHTRLAKVDVDWPKAKVIIRFVAGTNVTAGVSAASNWLVPFTKALSNNTIPDDRIYIAPYIDIKPSLGQAMLTKEDLNYYNYRFASTYNRTHVAMDVFSGIRNIKPRDHAGMPGDYGTSKATDVNDFIMRLKYSLSQPTEMLSNTVGFWMAGELAAKQWDVRKVDIPGLTVGLPGGRLSYPANNPEIL